MVERTTEACKKVIEEAIAKTQMIMHGHSNLRFTPAEYQRFHQCAYDLCSSNRALEGVNAMWLFGKFRGSLEDAILSMVLPSLADKTDAPLLRELIVMWSNYKSMAKWLARFFEYLERHNNRSYTGFVSLSEVSLMCFKELINQERMGLYVDRDLLKNALLVFTEICGSEGGSYYEAFEKAMLSETANHYSSLAQHLLLYESLKDYIQKYYWCVNQEKEIANYYLSPGMESKLLKVVKFHMIDQMMERLEEKHIAENCGITTDYQEGELLRVASLGVVTAN
ncbi:hypothetical protein Tsubulata_008700, partial [Turnera subulata]